MGRCVRYLKVVPYVLENGGSMKVEIKDAVRGDELFQRTVGGSRSIVLPGVGHSVAQYPETQKAIKQFLQQCCS